MMSKLQNLLKDNARLGLFTTMLFFASILSSAYVLYTLPNDLLYSQAVNVINLDMSRSIFLKVYIVTAITFACGIAAITFTLRLKKETLVFKEKSKDTATTQQNGTEGGSSDSGILATFRTSIEKLNDPNEILQQGLNGICKATNAGQGAVYLAHKEDDKRTLELKKGFALGISESTSTRFDFGEGLVGQAAASGKSLYLDEVPEGYIKIVSGLGSASPRFLFLTPLKAGEEVKGVIEIASFELLKETTRKQIEEMAQIMATKM